MAGAVVIIVAPSRDLHARTVAWELERLGAEPLILDLADYPLSWKLSLLRDGESHPSFALTLPGGRCLADADLAGVWWRRAAHFVIPEDVEDDRHRSFCYDECRSIVEGWIFGLGARVMNPLANERLAGNKPQQLAMAAACGLSIPHTLISNDPDEVRRFASDFGRGLIFKTLTSRPRVEIAPTKRLDATALARLDLLASGPCIFQEAVAPGLDIRVAVVDDRVFAAEIDIKSEVAEVDWRIDPNHITCAHELPDEVTRQLLAFHRAIGLRYGAYDFRIDATGTYRFLEVNTAGQYLWLETEAGLPISGAIAAALCGRQQPEPVPRF